MKYYQPAAAFRRLCDAFDQMPGIGEQGAKRMAEWLMYQSDIRDLHEILGQAATLKICSSCNLAVEDPDHCPLCADPERAEGVLYGDTCCIFSRSFSERLFMFCSGRQRLM